MYLRFAYENGLNDKGISDGHDSKNQKDGMLTLSPQKCETDDGIITIKSHRGDDRQRDCIGFYNYGSAGQEQ